MPALTYTNSPVTITWPVTRGDDESLPLAFANPGGYTITRGLDGFETVTVSSPIDLSGRTFTFSVSPTKGATPLFTGSVDTSDAATGELVLSLTDTQTDQLTASSYVFDLVEQPGTSSENTIIVGLIRPSGRATA